MCNVCKSLHERVVKIEKAHRFSYFSDIHWCGPLVNAHNFYQVHVCHPLFKDYPQVIHGWHMEKALLRFEVEVMLLCHTKNITNGRNMACHIGSCGDANVVHVDMDGSSQLFMFENDVLVDEVHHQLECSW